MRDLLHMGRIASMNRCREEQYDQQMKVQDHERKIWSKREAQGESGWMRRNEEKMNATCG